MVKSKSKVGKTDLDKAKQKLAEIGSGKFFKPVVGPNRVRILPPNNDSGVFYHEESIHYGLKKDGRGISIKFIGNDSPIMQYVNKLKQEGPEGEKLAKRLEPKTKYFANVIDRKTGMICIWAFSKKTLKILLSAMDDEDIGDITDLENGFDVIIDREGTGMTDTRYEVRVRPKSTPALNADGEPDLSKMLDLEAEVSEELSEEEQEDVIAENFGKSNNSKKSKSEDDDDDDDNDDDEEEEQKEVKKTKSSKKEDDDNDDDDATDDDDDDDATDDDDDYDEKPARKSRASKEVVRKRRTRK